MKESYSRQELFGGQRTTVTMGNANEIPGSGIPYVINVDGQTFYASNGDAVMKVSVNLGREEGVHSSANDYVPATVCLRAIYDNYGNEVTALNVRDKNSREPITANDELARSLYQAAKTWCENQPKPFTLAPLANCTSDPCVYRMVED